MKLTSGQRHQIAQQIYPALVSLAQGQGIGTYVDWFAQQTQGRVSNRKQIASILDIPERYFLGIGAPDITAVIVRKDTGLPGQDFWRANQAARNKKTWHSIMNQVMGYAWPSQCPY